MFQRMTDQLTPLSKNPRQKLAESFHQEFCDALQQSQKGYDLSVIQLVEWTPAKTPAYSIITALEKTAFHIYGKRVLNIAVKPSLNSIFREAGIDFKPTRAKNPDEIWLRLTEKDHHCFVNRPDLASEVFEAVLREDGFDCCSRFLQCSDARQCIHPDIMFSLQCTYRNKLIEGIVFYGQNRNI